MPIVSKEDPSRPFLSSSPSNGPESAKEGYVASDPQDLHFGDGNFSFYLMHIIRKIQSQWLKLNNSYFNTNINFSCFCNYFNHSSFLSFFYLFNFIVKILGEKKHNYRMDLPIGMLIIIQISKRGF